MNQSEKNHQSYVLPIAIMFALFFMIAFVTGYQNPLGVVIEKLSNGNPLFSQLGTLANFIAYAFMGYPAGILLQNKGFRVTALTAVSVGFTGVLITYLSGFIGSGQFPDLPDRRIRLGLLDVYAQHRRQPDAQLARLDP